VSEIAPVARTLSTVGGRRASTTSEVQIDVCAFNTRARARDSEEEGLFLKWETVRDGSLGAASCSLFVCAADPGQADASLYVRHLFPPLEALLQHVGLFSRDHAISRRMLVAKKSRSRAISASIPLWIEAVGEQNNCTLTMVCDRRTVVFQTPWIEPLTRTTAEIHP
jgi:hypothetical protein